MKKKIFIGLGLLGVAFSGAAFTANRAKLANHYIQKPGECKLISETMCQPELPNPCTAPDGGITQYPVFATVNPDNASQCWEPLGRPNE